MIVAPAGGAGALPLLLEPELLLAAGVVTEVDAPEPISWVVVVLADDGFALETEHPVKEKIPIDNVPMAQNPFRFNCIMDLSVGGGIRLSGQSRAASTLDVYGRTSNRITELALAAD